MVNIVTGEGMGLRDGSWSTVGGKHVGPNDVFGSSGESATVNLYNGNLIIQDQDALFKSLGLDSSVLRVYNSQSAKPWQFGVEKELEGLTGQVNTAGSSITRVGADGHKTVYNYDVASGRYVSTGSVKDTLSVKGDTWTWVSHDESITETYINNQLVESRDANGNVTKYEYSGKDLVSITDASGQTVRFTRVDNTLTISVEKDGKTESAVTYVYDSKQRLEQVKVDLNGDGKNIYVTSYTYDGDSNRIASITHSDGTKIAFTYIESNGVYKVETMTDGLGRKISFEYLDGKTIVTDANGQKTTYEYNDKGQITQITYPAVNGKQSTITYKYNDAGLLESITDNHGNATSFKYDANGNCIREENAAGDVIERVYDEHNHLVSQKVILNNESGKVAESHNIYDEHGNLRFHISADGRVVEYEYDVKGNLKSEHHYSKDNYAGVFDLASLEAWADSQTAESLTKYDYDFRGQISKVTTYPNSADKTVKTEVDYIYDVHGNLKQKIVFDADGKEYSNTYTYDAFGRLLTETDSQGHFTQHDYNAQTHTSTITFENGLVETYEYDDAGNLISKTASDSKHENRLISESSYVYDDNGNLIAESSNGTTKYYFYNELNQKIAEVDGNGHFTSYTYNDLGQLVATKQSANTVNTNSWLDSMPALADIQPQESADDRAAQIVYDKAGRVHYKIDAQGYVTEYFYNSRGDLIKETAYANALDNIPLSLDENTKLEIKVSSEDRSVEIFYDLDGNKTGQLDAAGYYTQYTYDAAGNLIQTTRFAEKQTAQAIKDNNLKTSDNDVTTQTIYNDKGQVTGQIDAEGYYTETKYDSFGNVASTTRYAAKTTDGNKPASNDKDQTITYTYNAQGQLLSSTNINGAITSYQYDEMGNLVLTQTTDNNTHETRAKANRYDAMGHLIAELSSQGQEALEKLLKDNPEATQAQIEQIWQEYATTHLYDEAGRRIQTTDANGHVMRFFYDANGQLTASINALGEVKTYAHNAFGESTETRTYAQRLTDEQLTTIKSATSGLISQSITDMLAKLASEKDSVQAFQYNNRGQLEVKTDAQQYTNRISYNAFGEITSQTQQVSADKETTTEFHYDAAGQLVETIYDKDNLKIKTSTKYDAFGRVTEQTDGNGNSINFTYDKLGRQLTATNAKQITTSSTYDAFGNVLTITDGRKNTTTYTYDAKTNSMIMTTAGGFSTRTTSNTFGDTITVTDANNNTVSYQYDADGNLTDVTDALNHNTNYDYDNTGLKTKSTDANGNVTEYHYNAIDQVTSVIVDPNGLNIETQYQYDTNGNKIRETIIDAKSGDKRITEYLYDKNNQLTDTIVDPDGIKLTTHYDYDGQGNVITLSESDKDGVARVTQYEFDALGRRTKSIVDPDGLSITENFDYDANSNLIEKTDANGNKIHYVYDELNQLRFTVDPEGGVSESLYDENGNVIEVRHYTNMYKGDDYDIASITSALTSDTEQDNVQRYVYNNDNQVIYEINTEGSVAENRYDSMGQVIERISYFNALVVSDFEYSNISEQIKPSKSQDRVTQYSYDAAGQLRFQLEKTSKGDFKTVEFQYDSSGHLTKQIEYATPLQTDGEVRSKSVLSWSAGDRYAGEPNYDLENGWTITVSLRNKVTGQTVNGTCVKVVNGHYEVELVGLKSGDYQVSIQYLQASGMVVSTLSADATISDQGITQFSGALSYPIDGEYHSRQIELLTTSGLQGLDADELSSRVTDSNSNRDTRYIYDNVGRLKYAINPDNVVVEQQYNATGDVIGTRSYAKPVNDLPASAKQSYTIHINEKVNVENHQVTRLTYWPVGNSSKKEIVTLKLVNGEYVADLGKLEVGLEYVYQIDFGQSTGDHFSSYESTTRAFYVHPGQNQSFDDEFTYSSIGSDGSVEHKTISGAVSLDVKSYQSLEEVVAHALAEQADAPRTRETRSFYDTAGRLTRSVDALGQEECFEYDALGNLLTKTDKNGNTTTYEYDKNGRLSFEHSPEVAVGIAGKKQSIITAYDYDALGNLVSKTAAYGTASAATMTYEYDKLGRLTITHLPEADVYNPTTGKLESVSLTTENVYDTYGNVVAMRDSAGNLRYNIYNKLGQVLYDVDANHQVTSYSYDSFGNATTITRHVNAVFIEQDVTHLDQETLESQLEASKEDRVIEQSFDINNRLIEKREPKTKVYDAGRDKAVLEQAVTRYSYDVFGQLTTESHNRLEDGKIVWDTQTYYYDNNGQQSAEINAQGYVATYSYDAFGNLLEKTEFAQALKAGQWNDKSYDKPTPTRSYDNPLKANGQNGQDRITTYTYDALNQLSTETRKHVWYSSISDLTGRFISERANITRQYQYDANGQMISSETLVKGAQDDTPVSQGDKSYLYYNALGQLIANVGPETATGRDLTTFSYDANGNQVGIKRWANGAASADAKSFKAGADSGQDQLNQVQYNSLGQAIKTIDANEHGMDMAYDAAGYLARTQQNQTDYDGKTHLRTVINTYDNVGNLIATDEDLVDGKVAHNNYQYNAFGEMTASGHDDKWITHYEYDNAGHMWRSNENGVLRYYLYDLKGNVNLTVQGVNDKVLAGINDVALLLTQTGVTKVYNRYDSLGNLVQQTNISANDKLVSQAQAYDRWGNVLTQTDVFGNQTNFWYNDNNQVIKQQKPKVDVYNADKTKVEKNPTSIYAYDAMGRNLGYLDPSQVSQKSDDDDEMTYSGFSTKQYDSAGRVTREVNADGGWTAYEYDHFGRVSKRTWLIDDNRTGSYTYHYDKMDNMVEQRVVDGDKETVKIKYTYDELGNITIQTNGEDESISYRYDTQDNIIEVRQHSGNKTLASYDGYGHRLTQTDALGVQTSFEYDDFGRIIKQKVVFDGDKEAHIAKVRLEYQFEYNLAGQLVKHTAKNLKNNRNSVKQYTYYMNGAIKEVDDSRINAKSQFEYDDAGHITRERFTFNDKIYQDSRYAYDVMGRLTSINDELDKYFIEYRYDENDNRRAVIAEDVDGNKQENWYEYDQANRIAKRRGTENVDLVYDKMGNRVYESGKDGATLNKFDAEGLLISSNGSNGNFKREYDDAGRVLREYDERNKELRESTYDSDGNAILQIVYNYSENKKGSEKYRITSIYDGEGNLSSYKLKTPEYTNTYVKHYDYIDGYKLSSESGTSSHFETGHSLYDYDAWGRLIYVTDVKNELKNQEFILNDKGEIVQKRQGEAFEKHYYVDGQVVGDVKGKQGANGEMVDGKMDFDKNITPVSQSYPGVTPSTVIIQKGDTLEILAQRLWGDSSLWYLLADANGLSGRLADLKEGISLNVPNYVTNIHNTNETFRPYNPGSILGDLTPTMPAPPPPKHHWWQSILVAVVAIVAVVATAGIMASASPAIVGAANSAAVTAGTIGAGETLGVMGLGSAVLTGSAGVGLGTLGIAGAAGVVGSVASQATAVATGLQDGISLRDALLGGLSAMAAMGVGAAVGRATNNFSSLKGLGKYTTKIATAAVTDGINQEVNMALGIQEKFNWRATVAAGAGAGLDGAFGESFDGVPGMRKSLNSIAQNEFITRGHMDAGTIAGTLIGNGITESFGQKHTIEQKVAEAQINNARNAATSNPLNSPYLDSDPLGGADVNWKAKAAADLYNAMMESNPADASSVKAKTSQKNFEKAAQVETFEMCKAPKDFQQINTVMGRAIELYTYGRLSKSEYLALDKASSNGINDFYSTLVDQYSARTQRFLDGMGPSAIDRNAGITAMYNQIAGNDKYAGWFAAATLASAKVGEGIIATTHSPLPLETVNEALASGNQRVFKEMVANYELYNDFGIESLKTAASYDDRIFSDAIKGYALQDKLVQNGKEIARNMELNYQDNRVWDSLMSDEGNKKLFNKATYRLVYHEQKNLLSRMYKYTRPYSHVTAGDLMDSSTLQSFAEIPEMIGLAPTRDLSIGDDLIKFNGSISNLENRLSFVGKIVKSATSYSSNSSGLDYLKNQRNSVLGQLVNQKQWEQIHKASTYLML